MTNDTPSSIDSAPDSTAKSTATAAVPSAPSDFLRHLPSSQSTALGAEPPLEPTSLDSTPPGSASKSAVDSHGRPLNPRSCVTCRRRKVKCDKTHPCANCSRAHVECIFPSPGRAPRKVRKPGDGKDKELLERLRRLEGVVKSMGVDVSSPEKDGSSRDGEGRAGGASGSMDGAGVGEAREASFGQNGQGRARGSQTATGLEDKNLGESNQYVEEQQTGRFENRFGRLVVNEGKSRYINNSFWANLSNEVEDLKGILNQTSDEEDIEPPTGTNLHMNATHQGWVFGFSSSSVDMIALHPLPNQIAVYWDIYKDRVDPLVKVLHIPTTVQMVLGAASRLSNLPKAFEALLFSIYYGATTSMSAEECQTRFGEEKAILLSRYRFAIEQSLSRANFLTTEEVVVLQAFVIFLICLRRNNDARVIWSLTGLVVRIAQTIGIHRDGSHFCLKPFEIEMRRRLWWQVCILDTRASEDHGCDPTIIEQAFDTKMPLNINDADIGPESTEFPPERVGCTDMSFSLIRFEVANTFRRINYIPPGPPRLCQNYLTSVTLQDKERWITACHEQLEEKYLKHCDMSVPIFWVTATVARLMMSKMWLMVYHPFQRQDGGASLSEETREKLFITSLENIEYSLLLETEGRTMKWGWLFKTYMQWHALAFLLSALCHRTTGDLVDRAWMAVDKTRDGRWGLQMTENTRAGHLWRPLKKLYRKAKEARQRGLREEAMAKRVLSNGSQRAFGDMANQTFDQRGGVTSSMSPTSRLSQAQLLRFTNGPLFGQVPLDKHEMLKSTNTGTGEDGMNASHAETPQFPSPKDFEAELPDRDNRFAMGDRSGYTRADFNMMQPQYQPSLAGQVGNVDLSDQPIVYPNMQSASPQDNSVLGGPPRTDSFGSNNTPDLTSNSQDLDMSNIMDTSGDLNWENWDQMVRQFGMDVDSSPHGNGDAVADWVGGQWDTMGIGLQGGGGGGGGEGGRVGGDGSVGNTAGAGGVPPGALRMGTGSGMGMGDWF